MIIIALVEARQYGFALIAVLASILTLWYYLLIQRRVFFGKLSETWKNVKEAPFWMTFSTMILGLVCIAVGIFFSTLIKTWLEPATDVLSAGIAHALSILGL